MLINSTSHQSLSLINLSQSLDLKCPIAQAITRCHGGEITVKS
ncbi:hypothetical protein M595_5724 [Lyngbya aestuarii BL J]|uniref:Uncharacterized protein n=1 Tax=Lyngbya aestuarii BL J TaxID=1348334 RepID=U7QBB3_9CYAN|nr:hypothetical protein M595_5724 [Lyngbya aestuarii BL J]